MLEAQKQILSEKQKVLNEVYEEAKKRARGLPLGKYQSLIKKMIIEATEEGTEEIFIGQEEKGKITEKLIQEINHQIKKGGEKGKLTFGRQKVKLENGFLIRSDKHQIDNSWENIIKSLREKTEDEVVKILF